MTIQMELGLRRLNTLPTLSSKGHWDGNLSDKDISVKSEMVDLNGLSFGYTSLRDLISPNSTKRGAPQAGEVDWCDLSRVTFKDRLVKQAARAYLQPMAVESNRETHFLLRCWTKLTNHELFVSGVRDYVQAPIRSCIGFVYSKLSLVFGVFLGKFQPQVFRFTRLRARN